MLEAQNVNVPNNSELPAGYRLTELGPLPEEWRVVRLGEVFEITQGKSLSTKRNQGVRPRPFLRTSNVYWGYLDLSKLDVMDFTEEEEKKFALQYGDLLVCEGGDVGRTAMWEEQMQQVYFQNHLHRLRARDNSVAPAFVMYWMQTAFTLLNLYSGTSNKTTIPNLSQGRLAAFPIPLPPLAEQRAIAHVLRTVQEAKEATARVIAAARELKKSLMRHLFTYGPVPADQTDQMPLQDTEIGPIPAHWRVVRLGEVGEIVTGKTPPTSNDEYWDGTIPFITPVDLEGKPIVRALRTISKKGLTKTKALSRSSVLVSCIGYIGKTGLVDTDLAATNQQINAIIPHEEIASSFYLLYVLTYLAPNLAARARMTTVPILSKAGLSVFPIPLPPLAEQREIARILQAVDEKIRAEETRQAALEGLFRSLLHHLMTAKIRLPREFVRAKDFSPLHSADPPHGPESPHSAEPSHSPESPHSAEPSHSPEFPHGAEPSH
ncbi:MAG: restriction endonuclease subunit S, partial [Anaerolineales bacterium]